jgi:N-acetylglucosaminyldiphosphoundecaprenol N-acetyl-beta-D-mannosaminyltransferase
MPNVYRANEVTDEAAAERVGHFDGYRIYADGAGAFIDRLTASAKAGTPVTAFYLNAHLCNLAWENPLFHRTLEAADLLYPDGMSVVWATRAESGVQPKRMTAGDFFDEFCTLCVERSVKLYFVAGDAVTLERGTDELLRRFPSLQLCGRHHGYIGTDVAQWGAIFADMERCTPDIVVLGMGSPLQETFALACRQRTRVPGLWTVGALLDYYGGRERLAPRWMGRMGLEWLFRLMQDPIGKWKRYTVGNLRFVWRARTAIRRNTGRAQ